MEESVWRKEYGGKCMEESLKNAKLSATISPYLKTWMLDRVNNKDFVSTSEITELAIAEFKRGYESYKEIQKMRDEIEELKARLDSLQKYVKGK